MNHIEVVTNLKKEVEKNPVANAVLHVCALRERTRSTLTLSSLAQKMKLEGFTYTEAQYAEVIKFLANQGFGKLDVDHKGRVRGLTDIKVTLQSIGAAAVQDAAKIKNARFRNTFTKLPVPVKQAPAPAKPVVEAPVEKNYDDTMVIAFSVGKNKMVKVEVPSSLTPGEIASLITKLKTAAV